MTSELMFSTLFGMLILKEEVSICLFIGGILIFVGSVLQLSSWSSLMHL